MRWDDIDAVSVCLSAGKLEEEEKVACGRGDAESSSAICVPRWKRKAWRHARMLPKWQVPSRPIWREDHRRSEGKMHAGSHRAEELSS